MSNQTEVTTSINLNYFHILTLVFIIAKLWEKIDWSWFWVLFPSILSIGLSAFIWIFILLAVIFAGPKR